MDKLTNKRMLPNLWSPPSLHYAADKMFLELWQSTRGKWWLTHWASLLRWIVHHKFDRKPCVIPTADRNRNNSLQNSMERFQLLMIATHSHYRNIAISAWFYMAVVLQTILCVVCFLAAVLCGWLNKKWLWSMIDSQFWLHVSFCLPNLEFIPSTVETNLVSRSSIK